MVKILLHTKGVHRAKRKNHEPEYVLVMFANINALDTIFKDVDYFARRKIDFLLQHQGEIDLAQDQCVSRS